MATVKHALINGLRQNTPLFGTFMMLSSGRTAQVIAQTGLDTIIIDCEHGNIDDRDMHDAVLAVSSCGVSPVVRVRGANSNLIKRALDAGAHGLMVPMINTAEEASLVVRASKFPPLGIRGQGSPFASIALGMTTPEYLLKANTTLMTIVQIETAEAVRNVDSIAAVAGVDMLFIGPNDLAFSLLGYTPAKSTEPVFTDAIDKVVAACKRHGKMVGTLVSTGEQAAEAGKRFDLVAIGGDVKALTWWFTDQLARARDTTI